jgi:hypothetical protein
MFDLSDVFFFFFLVFLVLALSFGLFPIYPTDNYGGQLPTPHHRRAMEGISNPRIHTAQEVGFRDGQVGQLRKGQHAQVLQ